MRSLIAVLLATACAAALAQAPMYRSTMPDGRRVISDRPMPGAASVEEIKVTPGNYAPGSPVPKAAAPASSAPATPSAGAAPKPGAPAGKPAAPGPAAGSKAAEREIAERELRSAQAAYDAAVANAAAGREEKEGDRQGTAKKGARLSDEYDKRQAQLQSEVSAAQARLDNARKRYNDSR